MLAVFKRELRAYFTSSTGFIFMGFFLLLSGFFFAMTNLFPASPDYNAVLGSITFIFLIVVPILTMRLMPDDKRQRTDQLLFTSPTSLTGIVLGKYFAAVSVFVLTLLITCIYPIILSFFGNLATWEIVGGYIGFLLLGSAFISIGLFISTLTENQVIAAVITFSALLFMWILDWVTQGLPTDKTSGIIFAGIIALALGAFVYFNTRNIYVGVATTLVGAIIIVLTYFLADKYFFDGFIVRVFEWFSLLKRYEEFQIGILSLSPIVYYITFSAAFVFLTIRVLEKRRWS
ncbi:MAG: ABC transporter permease [Caldicoprobacterales bacterium]|jgi:ABC-2 type transport system permease protein